MEVVLDCDIVSTLAKIDRINLLVEIFEDRRIVIPNAVYVELLESERIGFRFTEKIFQSQIEITTMLDSELIDFKNIVKNKRIHHGEAEGIAARKKVINEIEMIKLIKDIEVKDNTIIVEKDEILQEYEN